MAENLTWPETVTEWNRQTVADGNALNRNTIKPLIDRTQYLYDQIQDFSRFEIVNVLPAPGSAEANKLYVKVNGDNPDKAKIYVLNENGSDFIEIGPDIKVKDEVLFID